MSAQTKIAVDVIFGGPGREAPVSRQSGQAVAAALRSAGYPVAEIDLDGRLDPSRLRPGAIAFNVVHGTYGEDGTLQAELDALGVSYIGSGVAASRLCMDKAATRTLGQAQGLPVAWGVVIDPHNAGAVRNVVPPAGTGLVLKPRYDGSSVGLRMLASKSFLLPALEEVVQELGAVDFVLEERLPGPEFTVAILEREPGKPQALTPIRIVPAQGTYDFEAKYTRDDTRYEFVEESESKGESGEGADSSLSAILRARAVTLYQAAGCRDFARIDFMLGADGDPRLLEANTLPGFTSHSLVPKAAAHSGMDFTALCCHLVSLAEARLVVDGTGER